MPVKSVFVPIWINGRRYGNYELCYIEPTDVDERHVAFTSLPEEQVAQFHMAAFG
jgi:hypothetical protein